MAHTARNFDDIETASMKNGAREDGNLSRIVSEKADEPQAPSRETEQDNKLKDSTQAWIVCAGAFFIQVVNVGVLHAYGVFFVAFLHDFKCSRALAAWVGSAAYGLTMAFGMVASPLINRFGHGPVASTGSVICALSLLASSFAESIEILFVTFSLFYGIGCALAYTPTMCIADEYFDKYVSVATGIMTAGSSVGTLLLNPISQSLIAHVGWRNAMRFLAGISVFVTASGFTFKRLKPKSVTQRLKLPMTRRIVRELQLWKNKVFVIWVAAITLVMFGYYIPYVHLVTHAEDMGIPPDTGSILVMVLGGSTATGRLLFGKILEVGYMNRLSMHQLSMVVTGTFCMLLPLIRSFYGLLAYVIVVGLVDGCYVVLLPVLTAQWAGDDHRVMAWGFVVGVSSITYTLGPPVAGWIADATGSYDLAFHVAGIPIVFGSVILFLVPWAQKTARATNFLSAAKNSFAVPLGAGNSSDGINEEHKDMDDNDSILSGPLIEVRKCDEDAITLTTMDSSCLIVNLKTGTIAGRAGGRHEDTDTISEITKLHDIAQAIEILSRASASILDMERTSIMSSFADSRALSPSFDNQSARLGSQYNHDLGSLPMSSTSCSRQNAAVQTPNNGNLSNMDLESFFAHAHLDHSGGKLLSPYGSPLTFLTSPGGMPQQRESSNLSLPAVKEEERALHSAAVPTLRRTRYSSVPVDFMDSHGCDIDLIPHRPDNKAQPTDAENSGPVHSPETWPDTESNLVTSSDVAADDLSTDSSSVCSAVNPSIITASSGPASSIESSNNRFTEPPQMITPEIVFHQADEGSVPIANSGETDMSHFTSQDDVSSSQITVTMSTANDKTD